MFVSDLRMISRLEFKDLIGLRGWYNDNRSVTYFGANHRRYGKLEVPKSDKSKCPKTDLYTCENFNNISFYPIRWINAISTLHGPYLIVLLCLDSFWVSWLNMNKPLYILSVCPFLIWTPGLSKVSAWPWYAHRKSVSKKKKKGGFDLICFVPSIEVKYKSHQ